MTTNNHMSITFTDRQLAVYRADAKRTGISYAEIVRRVLDRDIDEREAKADVIAKGAA